MSVKPKNKVKSIKAAQMLAEGVELKTIAAELNVSYNTARNWARDPDVLEEYRKCLKEMVAPMFAKSFRALAKQLDCEKQPWLVQGAAREIMSRFGAGIMGDDDKDVVVRFESGQTMPAIGVPQAPTEDE